MFKRTLNSSLRSVLLLAALPLVALFVHSRLGAASETLEVPSNNAVDQVTVSTTDVSDQQDVSLIHSDDTRVVFDVSVPSLQRDVVQTDSGRYERISLAGYGSIGEPGEPALPQIGVMVAVPPGAEPVASVVSAQLYTLTDVSVLPEATRELSPDYDLTDLTVAPEFVISYAANEEIYRSDRLYPRAPVSLEEVAQWRDQRVARLAVTPVLANPGQQALTVYTDLRVEVRFEYASGRAAAAQGRQESAAYDAVLRDSILNYEEARNWRVAPESSVVPQVSPCLDANAFRIDVVQTGIYEITYVELAAQGFPAGVQSNKIRVCNGGQELSVKVEDTAPPVGTFGSGDKVVFYGEAIKTQESEVNAYWLTYSTGGPNGLRMDPGVDSAGGSLSTFYSPEIHLETDTVYYSLFPTADLNDHWYWKVLRGKDGVPEQTLDMSFNVSDIAPGNYNFPVRVMLWGFNVNEAHPFEVLLNGASIGQGQFNGSGRTTSLLYQTSAPSAELNDGQNTLTIKALENGTPEPFQHWMLVDWAEVEPRKIFRAEGNRLAFEQNGNSDYTFSADGFSPGGASVEVYDLTDPFHPTVELKNATGGQVSFRRVVSGTGSFELRTTGARLSPSAIVKDTVPNELLSSDSNQADYIIITDPSLDSALTPLRNLRASQGLVVKTVFVQDIFDEFGYGLYSTEAIRGFLEYAYQSWQSPAPSYVLLAGDGHYDHRDVLGLNATSPILVPVYLRSGIDPWLGETAADNQYVDWDGQKRTLPDMMLGRLPASNSAELSNMVAKIVTYEASAPTPGWHQNHFFVTDNSFVPPACNQDGAGDFFAHVNDFLDGYFPPGYALHRLYYAPGQCFPNATYPTIEDYYALSMGEMRARLVQMYDRGNQFVVYMGHSGTTQWGHENYVDRAGAAAMSNGDRTPIQLAMTCLVGYHMPQGNNLSEEFLKNTNGGSVANYAPTGLHVQTGHDYLIRGFYSGIFDDGYRRLGQAVLSAKSELTNGDDFVQDLHDTFMLYGDPALYINAFDSLEQNFMPLALGQ